MNSVRLASLCLAALLMLVSSGCSSFDRAWKASATPSPGSDPFAGRWQGHWLSDKNQHTGKLRCILNPSGPGRYQARFHATFWKIFSAGYSVTLTGQRTNQVLTLRGNQDLGWLGGGTYTYEAQVTPSDFDATYRSAADHGTFRMSRP